MTLIRRPLITHIMRLNVNAQELQFENSNPRPIPVPVTIAENVLSDCWYYIDGEGRVRSNTQNCNTYGGVTLSKLCF